MSFDKFCDLILHHEGGYVFDKNDPGGETIYGISKRHHPKAWEKGRPSVAQAKAIYKRDYWGHGRLQCAKLHPAIALNVFDSAVNQGVRRAAMILQDALDVTQDGYIGPVTVKAANKNPKRTIERFTALRIKAYSGLGKIWEHYHEGWMVRVLRTYEESLKEFNPQTKGEKDGKSKKQDQGTSKESVARKKSTKKKDS